MTHSLPLKTAAVVSALFGVVLLFGPNALVALYGAIELNATGIYNTMLYGCALIALAVMYWVASTLPELEARTTMLGGLVANGLGLLVALYRQFTSASVPVTAWVNIGIFLAFTIVFARLYLRRGEKQPQAGVVS